MKHLNPDNKMPINQNHRNVLVIIYNNFGPYHLARLNAATHLGRTLGYKVIGLEIASREERHPWSAMVENSEVTKYTLFPGQMVEEVPALDMLRAMWGRLNLLDPQGAAIAGSKNFGVYAALAWARIKKRVAVLMMDSKYDDFPRKPAKEWAKKEFYFPLFDAILAAGVSSKAYAEFLGVSPDRILLGSDVVDNDYFSRQADEVRENASQLRRQHKLPEKYFLFVSRLVPEKNVFRLLEAYAHYVKSLRNQAWGLVICGSGPLEHDLKAKAAQLQLQQVYFLGFTQIEALPVYYGLANCLILPSIKDTWGLTVNEAMASGLPVLVSRACGCAPDLVQSGINGFVFEPRDVDTLTGLMVKMSSGQIDLEAMGAASRHIIADWGLETFARNLFKTLNVGVRYRNSRRCL